MALKALSAGYKKASHNDVIAALNQPISSATLDSISSQVSILHCVSAYPAPLEDLNLSAITTLQNQFCLKTGFSDHSLSNLGAITAVALGASIIETHHN
jgi:sialic acid synthase SpsE